MEEDIEMTPSEEEPMDKMTGEEEDKLYILCRNIVKEEVR
jgi:hypothetical protein